MNRGLSRSSGASFQMRVNKRRKLMSIFRNLFFVGFLGSLAGFVILGLTVYVLSRGLPDVETINTYIPAETTKIYSQDGIILAELHQEENRILIPIEHISETLLKTVVAVEDTDFYEHHGLNFKGILRALYKDIKARAFVEGGSTITQQLARNLFLHKRKKIIRKIEEAIIAVQIERQYTKTEILEMYLNQVYWGHNSYGIESASQLYFGKRAEDISLAESAMLVGLLRGPELYTPHRNFQLAKRRQNVVLNRMKKLGILSKEQASEAYNEELLISRRKKFKYKAPFFTEYVVGKLVALYGEEATYTSGLKVYTTLNYALQEHAETVVKDAIDIGNREYWIKGEKVPSLNYSEAAILAMDPRTGYIKVMQGGVDFLKNQFNHCIQANRQPGSAFKPIVYLAALEKGLSPGTFIEDSPVTFNTIEGPYSPQNYNQKFMGNIPLRKALERSINVVAVKVNDFVNPKSVVRVARDLGITSPLKPILSLPLGANEVTMMELASVYGVFANDGIRVEPAAIIRIEDRNGVILYQNEVLERSVFDSNLIAALVEMLRGVVDYGTGRGAKLPRPMAGKTGTTTDYKDAWFFGFVPQMVCATWVGNDDNKHMNGVTGGWIPARMWREFMKVALQSVPPQDFLRPRKLVQRKVNWKTGLLATNISGTRNVTIEKYWRGSEPKEYDTVKTLRALKQKEEFDNKEKQDLLKFFNMN
ncbi:MAG: PBP1A family penicillin-binding protein [Candidatus Margulisbacteria bacterium]|nr:PBP1A family penicillin-binding protein [Candidatus Margulisiibacteriota bacterium]